MDCDMHSAGIGVILIGLPDANGNTNFVNKANDRQEIATTTAQGNDLGFHSGGGGLGLKLGRPIDRTSGNCDDVSHTAAYAHRVIVVLVTVETSEISIRVGVNSNGCHRLNGHSLVLGSNEVVSDLCDCNFMQTFGVEHERCSLTDNVR